MSYERDEAMRQQEATEAMIRMRDPRPRDAPQPVPADRRAGMGERKLTEAQWQGLHWVKQGNVFTRNIGPTPVIARRLESAGLLVAVAGAARGTYALTTAGRRALERR